MGIIISVVIRVCPGRDSCCVVSHCLLIPATAFPQRQGAHFFSKLLAIGIENSNILWDSAQACLLTRDITGLSFLPASASKVQVQLSPGNTISFCITALEFLQRRTGTVSTSSPQHFTWNVLYVPSWYAGRKEGQIVTSSTVITVSASAG